MASTTQNQWPHPVPTNHTGYFVSPASASSHFLEPEWAFVLFCSETESHYVSLAGPELSVYTALALNSLCTLNWSQTHRVQLPSPS